MNIFGGEEPEYPHDPDGSAEQVINCRCVVVGVLKDKKANNIDNNMRGVYNLDDEYSTMHMITPGALSLLSDYNNSVDSGRLSPIVSYDDYKNAVDLFNDKLIGLTTADGVEIKGYSKHFIDRYFGSVSDRRSGVELKIIIDALSKDNTPKISRSGIGRKYITDGAEVSVNPITGIIIQTNPRSRKRKR